MPVTLVLGAQWGDEGKGKIVDVLVEESDIVARFQGGANAGHTVIVNGTEYILHLLPTGILHPNCTCIIGGGVVIDPVTLFDEIEKLSKMGIDVNGRLFISHQAHLIMPYHRLLEGKSEQAWGEKAIGTTGRGIGPAYVDKMARVGIRIVDLLDRETFRQKLLYNIQAKSIILEKVYGDQALDAEAIVEEYLEFDRRMDPYINDTSVFLQQALSRGDRILLEGAQGTLLDIDFGTYPYVTSSSTTAGGAMIGLGIGPRKIDKVIGVIKAYSTRVGNGPMPTEFPPEMMDEMREKGGEFGATTGRPRRVGWFDAVAARYSGMINGVDGWAVTKLDILSGLQYLNIAVSYRDGTGKLISHFPADAQLLGHCHPVYEQLDSWEANIQNTRTWDGLPLEARNYLEFIEDTTQVPV
ncbi:adenylosuccinate synthetase, partial [bacterium SM23_57]